MPQKRGLKARTAISPSHPPVREKIQLTAWRCAFTLAPKTSGQTTPVANSRCCRSRKSGSFFRTLKWSPATPFVFGLSTTPIHASALAGSRRESWSRAAKIFAPHQNSCCHDRSHLAARPSPASKPAVASRGLRGRHVVTTINRNDTAANVSPSLSPRSRPRSRSCASPCRRAGARPSHHPAGSRRARRFPAARTLR